MFYQGLKRTDKTNLIDVYVSGLIGKVCFVFYNDHSLTEATIDQRL